MANATYLSPKWFRKVASVLDQVTGATVAPDCLVEECRLVDGTHTKIFQRGYAPSGSLQWWIAGRLLQPDVIVTESLASSWRGLTEGPSNTWRDRVYDAGNGQTVDWCGLPRVAKARPALVTSVRIDLMSAELDEPLGAVYFGIDECGVVHRLPQEHEGCRFSINATYAEMMAWLHGALGLGHLMYAGRRVTGDVWDLSLAMGLRERARSHKYCEYRILVELDQCLRNNRTMCSYRRIAAESGPPT